MSGPVLIYDGNCPFCTGVVGVLQRVDARGRLRYVPAGAPGVLDAYGLTAAQVQASVWLRHPSGAMVGGAGAAMCALDAVCGGRFGSLLYSWGPARRLLDRGYAWVAANRMRLRLGGVFGAGGAGGACGCGGGGCGDGGACECGGCGACGGGDACRVC